MDTLFSVSRVPLTPIIYKYIEITDEFALLASRVTGDPTLYWWTSKLISDPHFRVASQYQQLYLYILSGICSRKISWPSYAVWTCMYPMLLSYQNALVVSRSLYHRLLGCTKELNSLVVHWKPVICVRKGKSVLCKEGNKGNKISYA